jgi:hypothetical protein
VAGPLAAELPVCDRCVRWQGGGLLAGLRSYLLVTGVSGGRVAGPLAAELPVSDRCVRRKSGYLGPLAVRVQVLHFPPPAQQRLQHGHQLQPGSSSAVRLLQTFHNKYHHSRDPNLGPKIICLYFVCPHYSSFFTYSSNSVAFPSPPNNAYTDLLDQAWITGGAPNKDSNLLN